MKSTQRPEQRSHDHLEPARARRIVVGMSGATGTAYGVRLLEALRELGVETHLVVSKAAELTAACESDMTMQQIKALADVVHPHWRHRCDRGIWFVSHHGHDRGPLLDAQRRRNRKRGDLKPVDASRRRLPQGAAASGAPGPGGAAARRAPESHAGGNGERCDRLSARCRRFYNRPQAVGDIVDHTVSRVLDLFELDAALAPRWQCVATATAQATAWRAASASPAPQCSIERPGMNSPKALRLYHFSTSNSSWRVRWALALKGVTCEYVTVDLATGEQHSPEHIARNPLGLVPVLERIGAADPYMAETVAIIDWLDHTYPEPRLLPQEPLARAKAHQLAQLINADTHPLQNRATAARHSDDPQERLAWNKFWISKGLAAYEVLVAPLAGRFSLGDEISYPDLFLVPMCRNALNNDIELQRFPILEGNLHTSASYGGGESL